MKVTRSQLRLLLRGLFLNRRRFSGTRVKRLTCQDSPPSASRPGDPKTRGFVRTHAEPKVSGVGRRRRGGGGRETAGTKRAESIQRGEGRRTGRRERAARTYNGEHLSLISDLHHST